MVVCSAGPIPKIIIPNLLTEKKIWPEKNKLEGEWDISDKPVLEGFQERRLCHRVRDGLVGKKNVLQAVGY